MISKVAIVASILLLMVALSSAARAYDVRTQILEFLERANVAVSIQCIRTAVHLLGPQATYLEVGELCELARAQNIKLLHANNVCRASDCNQYWAIMEQGVDEQHRKIFETVKDGLIGAEQ